MKSLDLGLDEVGKLFLSRNRSIFEERLKKSRNDAVRSPFRLLISYGARHSTHKFPHR